MGHTTSIDHASASFGALQQGLPNLNYPLCLVPIVVSCRAVAKLTDMPNSGGQWDLSFFSFRGLLCWAPSNTVSHESFFKPLTAYRFY